MAPAAGVATTQLSQPSPGKRRISLPPRQDEPQERPSRRRSPGPSALERSDPITGSGSPVVRRAAVVGAIRVTEESPPPPPQRHRPCPSVVPPWMAKTKGDVDWCVEGVERRERSPSVAHLCSTRDDDAARSPSRKGLGQCSPLQRGSSVPPEEKPTLRSYRSMPPKVFHETIQQHLQWRPDSSALTTIADEPTVPAAPPTSPYAPRVAAVGRLQGSISPGHAVEKPKLRGRRTQGGNGKIPTVPRICAHDIRLLVTADLPAPQHLPQQSPKPQSSEQPRQRPVGSGRGRASLDSQANIAAVQPEREPPTKADAKLEKDLHYLAKSAHAMSMPSLTPLTEGSAPSYPKLLGGLGGQPQKPV